MIKKLSINGLFFFSNKYLYNSNKIVINSSLYLCSKFSSKTILLKKNENNSSKNFVTCISELFRSTNFFNNPKIFSVIKFKWFLYIVIICSISLVKLLIFFGLISLIKKSIILLINFKLPLWFSILSFFLLSSFDIDNIKI